MNLTIRRLNQALIKFKCNEFFIKEVIKDKPQLFFVKFKHNNIRAIEWLIVRNRIGLTKTLLSKYREEIYQSELKFIQSKKMFETLLSFGYHIETDTIDYIINSIMKFALNPEIEYLNCLKLHKFLQENS